MTYLVTTERLISLGIEQWRERVVPGARFAPCSHGPITPQITFHIEVAA